MVASSSSCIRRRWFIALGLIAGLATPADAGFTIRDLGVIAPNGTSGALAIGGGGQAAGMASGPGGGQVAAVTSGSGGFHAVTLPADAVTSVARSINGAGDAAGSYVDKLKVEHGFYTSSGAATVLGPLAPGGTYTQANGINNGGQVVGTGDVAGGATRAFLASGGGSPTVINPLGTGGFCVGNGINDKGTVIGSSETLPMGLIHAFITGTDGRATDLAVRNIGGAFQSNTYGTAIANNGDAVGYGDLGRFAHAFYAAGAGGGPMVDLGVLAGASSSEAAAVNNAGLVVGGDDYGPGLFGSNSRAFLWDAQHGMVDLNSLIPAGDQSTWILTRATGINDSDQISGMGYFNGVLHGFVASPIGGEPLFAPAAAVPAPPTLVLSLIGGAIASAGSRFRSKRKLRRGRSGGRAAA